MSKTKILIIEDERALQEVLVYNLEREGFEVAVSGDGQDGIRRARATEPDVILLDLMLPVIDGLEVCRQLRADAKTRGIRILMLTARSEEVDEIVGFNMGADDYVTKPFKVKPLIHRIKALLRRTATDQQSREFVSIHGIEVDRVNHIAKSRGQILDLTPTEFRLLWALARAAGRPFGRNELMDHCRGEDANALERTIDVHIRSLRQKLGELGEVIETVRGIGYRFRGETESATNPTTSIDIP
ncbi:response regulator [Schlesneria paludicola]|uniref:response regulator n=1 Tax=Schlesneria paludicola TaxID=360056 RepID=UPI00029A2179|nr:response regulator transcription factor [Schlesneria paludicola]